MYNNKDNENTFAVYCHYFPNGKVYVGLTSHCDDVEEKRFGHNGSKYKKQALMYRAILKYGWDNIDHEIIAKYISRESAINIEKDLIALYRSNEPEHGYNISPGGESGSYHSEESRKKMSVARKGKKKSEEHRRKIGEAHRGMKRSEETRKKISEKAKGRKQDTDNNPRNIPILQYRIDTGEFVARYVSAAKAGRELNVPYPHIHKCAKDKRRQVANCVWIYEKDATKEYVQYRISKAKYKKCFQPIVFSRSSEFKQPIYCESVSLAARFVNGADSSIQGSIDANRPYHGYYFKRISPEEYLQAIKE